MPNGRWTTSSSNRTNAEVALRTPWLASYLRRFVGTQELLYGENRVGACGCVDLDPED